MAKVIADGLRICSDCVLLIANGETGNGVETDERIADAQYRKLGTDARWLCLTGTDQPEFSWKDCDGCGDPLGGDRSDACIIR